MPETVLTMDTITAAQNNDLAATSAVIEATDGRVKTLANVAANRMRTGLHAAMLDEFTQVGRIAVWEALARFTGSTVDSFYAHVHRSVETTLLNAVRAERNPATGADDDAMKVFASVMELAGGDEYLAEKLSQTVPPKGRRLSATRANAARMSWVGCVPLAARDQEPAVYDVPDDLVDAADITSEERRRKCALVVAILDTMGEAQRNVLLCSFGIAGAPFFGHGDSGDDIGLAAHLFSTVARVRDARTKGLRAFAKRYVAVAAKSPADAASLTAAAAKCLAGAGRK